jgi:dolichyl-phosphate beta-glucosyltransferase
MNPKFSIIIPAYNESNRIVRSLNKILGYFKNKKVGYEIIIVNDGSPDNTFNVVRDLSKKNKKIRVISYNKNRGKGYAVKTGVLNSSGEYILFTDADLSTPIEELENLMDWTNQGYDFIFGSRGIDSSKVKVKQPLYRRIFAFLARVYVQLVVFTFAATPKDTQCGFKLFTRKTACFLFRKMKIDGGMFDIELLYIAKKWGIKTKEVPVIWANNTDSKIKFIKCILFDPIDLIKLRIYDLAGKYN